MHTVFIAAIALGQAFSFISSALHDVWGLLSAEWPALIAWTVGYFLAWFLLRKYGKWFSEFSLIRATGVYILIVGVVKGLSMFAEGHDDAGLLLFFIGVCFGLALTTLEGIDAEESRKVRK